MSDTGARRKNRASRPAIEAIEQRILMTTAPTGQIPPPPPPGSQPPPPPPLVVGIHPANRHLSVVGDQSSPDTVTVTLDNGNVVATINGKSQTLSIATVKTVFVACGDPE